MFSLDFYEIARDCNCLKASKVTVLNLYHAWVEVSGSKSAF